MMIVVAIVIPVIAVGVIVGLLFKPAPVQAIDGIECEPAEVFNYHVHAHLNVFIDGSPSQIPASIGILSSPACFYWLHTHSTDGIIHIESPSEKAFTLGQFIDVWNQTRHDSLLSKDLSTKSVSVYVNGTKMPGDYRDVQLQSREEIALVIGNAPSTIPSEYPSNGPPR